MKKSPPAFKLLICDLDNTLYDWVAYFVPSFYAMVDKVVALVGCDRQKLLDDFREIHQRHHDTEHPFALLETRTVIDYYEGLNRSEIAQELNPAFHAFNSARIKHLKLHPGVKPAIEYIRQRDVKLVAHTESQLFGAIDRVMRLSLTELLSEVYCRERPRQDHPNPEAGIRFLNRFPMYKVHELSKHQVKPDPTVLTEICSAEKAVPGEVAYIGDSISRDILMAKKAGIFSIWAKYGAVLHTNDYERLIRVTHWTNEDVENERRLKKEAEQIRPDFVAENSFVEVLHALFPNECIDFEMPKDMEHEETRIA